MPCCNWVSRGHESHIGHSPEQWVESSGIAEFVQKTIDSYQGTTQSVLSKGNGEYRFPSPLHL